MTDDKNKNDSGAKQMLYREYENKDISAIRDILERDLGYHCSHDALSKRVNEMTK